MEAGRERRGSDVKKRNRGKVGSIKKNDTSKLLEVKEASGQF